MNVAPWMARRRQCEHVPRWLSRLAAGVIQREARGARERFWRARANVKDRGGQDRNRRKRSVARLYSVYAGMSRTTSVNWPELIS
jgi:hypothetical protein